MRNVLSNSTLDRPSGKLPLSRFHVTIGFGSPVSCEIIQTENIVECWVILSIYERRQYLCWRQRNGHNSISMSSAYVLYRFICNDMRFARKWVNVMFK